MLDVEAAASFTALRLEVMQLSPCMNSTGSAAPPAFCPEFSQPAVCGSGTYVFDPEGNAVPQCRGAGASMVLNVLNPDEPCVPGPPPVQHSIDLTAWLQEQMDIVSGSKWKNMKAVVVQNGALQFNTVSWCS